MLPIKDTIRSWSFPVVNWMLIVANAIVWFMELGMAPDRLERLIYAYGLVPANIDLTSPWTLLPFFSHMFLHGGWLHFLSNIWILFIFGDNVEDRLGSGRYLIFYLAGGIAAGILQTVVDLGSTTPAIGASGAIAAVMGAYLLLYPRARVTTLALFIIPFFVQIPAVVFLGFWFVLQLYSGVMALAATSGMGGAGIAWWAHVGGFLFGFIVALPYRLARPKRREYADEYYPW